MSDDQGSKVFDLPHARVTLTPVGPGIEIEVWPKQGQSAYAVVDPTVAVLIAQRLVELAAAQLAGAQRAAAAATDPTDPTDRTEGIDDLVVGDRSDNVVDLSSRRRPGR